MGTRQGSSAGMTHAMTASVPMRSTPKETKPLTDWPRVLSSTAVSAG